MLGFGWVVLAYFGPRYGRERRQISTALPAKRSRLLGQCFGGDNGGSVGPISGLLSPKRTAEQAGDDPRYNNQTRRRNAHQGSSYKQRHPSQSKNSDQQRKEGDGDGPQPRNLDASSVVRAGGYPDPRRARPISTGRDDLRLGVGRLGLWCRLRLHSVIPDERTVVMWEGGVRSAMRAMMMPTHRSTRT